MTSSPTFKDFNPTNDPRVDEIKAKTDELIAIVRASGSGGPQAFRRAAIAITNYEQAAMWAVKACFSADDV